MTLLGWIFMISSWTLLFILTGYCFWKILKKKKLPPPEKTIHSA